MVVILFTTTPILSPIYINVDITKMIINIRKIGAIFVLSSKPITKTIYEADSMKLRYQVTDKVYTILYYALNQWITS